jgi:hypothetical protein
MSAVWPKGIWVDPDEAELYGGNAAIVMAHIRYRCGANGAGRITIGGDRWWRVSVSDLSREVGLSIQAVRTALKTLANMGVGESIPGTDDTTKAYRVAVQGAECQTTDQAFVSGNKRQDDGESACCQQQDPLLAATNAPLLETLETKRTHTSCV